MLLRRAAAYVTSAILPIRNVYITLLPIARIVLILKTEFFFADHTLSDEFHFCGPQRAVLPPLWCSTSTAQVIMNLIEGTAVDLTSAFITPDTSSRVRFKRSRPWRSSPPEAAAP